MWIAFVCLSLYIDQATDTPTRICTYGLLRGILIFTFDLQLVIIHKIIKIEYNEEKDCFKCYQARIFLFLVEDCLVDRKQVAGGLCVSFKCFDSEAGEENLSDMSVCCSTFLRPICRQKQLHLLFGKATNLKSKYKMAVLCVYMLSQIDPSLCQKQNASFKLFVQKHISNIR